MLLVFLLALPFINAASELPAWHMKPLGSHIQPGAIDETFANNMISPKDFVTKYVNKEKPLVFKDIVKEWPAFKLWTDEYLKEKYGDMELRLEGKKEKSSRLPKGDVCLGRDTLRTFLNDYQKGADKYVVSELPTPMWHEVQVPPPMGCGDIRNRTVEIDLWINSDTGKEGEGGFSIIHKDALNTINCVINGTKDWKLIELQYNDFMYQSWEGEMDAGYGGYSLVNPQKVDAKKFPNIGKIPQWYFAKIKAGDCLYLPRQMWHQVKSYGTSNKAVAFLFSMFEENPNSISTSDCPENVPVTLLSEVDVSLQYPGKGLMTMGHGEISELRQELLDMIVKRILGKNEMYQTVYQHHEIGAINEEIFTEKTNDMYAHLLRLAGGNEKKMTKEFVKNLTNDQIRPCYHWVYPTDPANSCTSEYSSMLPEDIREWLNDLKRENAGKLNKRKFLDAYEKHGGTASFGEQFWKKLAGDKETIENIPDTIKDALSPYEKYRRENPEKAEQDDDARITTPQGHLSEPKRHVGGYVNDEEGGDDNDDDDDDDDDERKSERQTRDEL